MHFITPFAQLVPAEPPRAERGRYKRACSARLGQLLAQTPDTQRHGSSLQVRQKQFSKGSRGDSKGSRRESKPPRSDNTREPPSVARAPAAIGQLGMDLHLTEEDRLGRGHGKLQEAVVDRVGWTFSVHLHAREHALTHAFFQRNSAQETKGLLKRGRDHTTPGTLAATGTPRWRGSTWRSRGSMARA